MACAATGNYDICAYIIRAIDDMCGLQFTLENFLHEGS
mgnify:CR=1 FL=1